MAEQSKKAIIFDFGNVIAFFDYDKVTNNLAKLSKGRLSADEVKHRLFAKDLLEEFEIGKISTADFIKEVKQRLNFNDVSDQEIINIYCDLFTPNVDVIKTIKQIPPNVTLILGSTTNPIHFNYYRAEFSDVLDRFKAFVVSFDLGFLKPNPVFYEQCLEKANCQPSECIYVDDIPEYIEAASQMGIEGIVYDKNIDLVTKLGEKGIKMF